MKVLDFGYVDLVETWGSDERIIEAARMSTGKGFLGWGPNKCEACGGGGELCGDGTDCPKCKGEGVIAGDEKLLRYLYENKHATPFEMAGMVIEVKAPIFVFREWHRHRTQSFNEMSARYVPLPDENYIPSVERIMMSGGSNKQAQGQGACLDGGAAEAFRQDLEQSYWESQNTYEGALKDGVPKELARLCLPVGRYSKMRASANLRNWLGFLTLRMAPNAQWEIREYANAVDCLIKDVFPRTWELFSA